MSAHDTTGRRRTLLVRSGGLLTALLAAIGLVLLPAPAGGQARAAAGTGDSSVTKSGTKGPYDDFSGLKVTVDQTENLDSQGVKVTWTGGAPTTAGQSQFGYDFLQIMQCWGDSPDGPDRDQCEWGNAAIPSSFAAWGRTVHYAPTNGGTLDDPRETLPASPSGQALPFRSATGRTTTDMGQFFSMLTTNAQAALQTGVDGTGESIFSLKAQTDADYLGCGGVAGAGAQPAPCWLVVVPRGEHEPDGAVPGGGLATSPLSRTNWDQRIQFRLGFKPVGAYCTIDQKTQPTVGADMIRQAMASWQPTLCTSEKVSYDFLMNQRSFIRQQVLTGGTDGQLGFVEDPVIPPPGSPPVVHAPVAVSGLVIAFNIQLRNSSQQVPRVRLDARLVAKMLTESYQCDIPGPNSQVVRGKLTDRNPQKVDDDPEFKKLNPSFQGTALTGCRAGFQLPQGQSDYAAMLWRWLNSDADAKAFLAGRPDEWGMTINPNFLANQPDTTSLSEFPKPDPTTWAPVPENPNLALRAVTVNPYGNDLRDDAVRVRSANNKGSMNVDTNSIPMSYAPNVQLPGSYFMLGLTDAATAAAYRLGTAELLNADGQFVAPTTDSLDKAVDGMKDGAVPGVLDQDPGLKTPGAYPLTSVTYAAASTGLDSASRTDYATLMRYAAGAGQAQGIGNGLLPPGYAPLTKTLHDQALAAADRLVAGVPPAGDTGAGGGGGGSAGGAGGSSGSSSAGLPGSTAGTSAGSATGGASPSTSAPAAAAGGTGGPGASPPSHNVAETGGTTPGALLGAVRWVLLTVLVAGIAGSLAGPLLMRAGAVRTGGGSLFRPRRPSTDLRAPKKEILG
ncbi:hypothetical protein [Streptomyces sp. NRRL F-5123]|uniref:hypothetical protein n=1 Tax=Streptomyces sp. NRRL F-5123 TaxID=1463856 RepID=UPI0004E229C6|nr:hypothetical protein [Streptomyces sp. NRRL F-5123]